MIKNYKSSLFSLFFLFWFFFGFSQSGGNSPSDYLNKITPLSPNSAAFEKYGIFPVNLSAGVVTSSIPLFDIYAGKNKFNLSINYSSQGLRVDETPTNLGMGWSLNIGSVTRSVRDLPDERPTRLSDIPQIVGDDNYNIGNSLANNPSLDSERDIFSVNVDGLSTKFIIDQQNNVRKVIKLTVDDNKIELIGLISEIVVTAPNGNIYHFGGNEGVEQCFTRPYQIAGVPPTMYNTAWLLSRVEYPDGNFINFNYAPQQVIYTDGLTQTADVKFSIPTNTESGLPQLNYPGNQLSFNRATIACPISIQSPNSLIEFQNGSFQNFLDGTFPKINSITQKNGAILFKKIDFNFNEYDSVDIGNNNYSTSVKRPFLGSVTFNDRNNSKIYSYDMEYYSPDLIPSRFSYSQDLLGYNNGKNNRYFIFNSLADYNYFPDHSLIIADDDEFNSFMYNASGDRKPNINFSKNGTLKKITYPTKGYSEFEYEGNLTDIREKILPPYDTTLNIENIGLPVSGGGSQSKVVTFSVPFDQKFYITGYSNTTADQTGNCPDPNHDQVGFSISNANYEQVPIYSISDSGNITSNPPTYFPMGTVSFFDDNSSVRMYSKLIGGQNYHLELFSWKCINAKVNFAYLDSPSYDGNYVEAGGLRIKSIKNYDFNQNLVTTKNYEYEQGQFVVRTPPISTMDRKDILINLIGLYDFSVGSLETKSVSLSSNPRWGLRNISGEFYTYAKVIEKDMDVNQLSLGKIEHYFDTGQVGLPVQVQYYKTSYSNLSTFKYKANEIQTNLFNSQNILLKKTVNNFFTDYPQSSTEYKSYAAKPTFETKCAPENEPNSYSDCPNGSLSGVSTSDPRLWSIMMTYLTPIWEHPISQVVTNYVNNTALTTTTEFFYNNLLYHQLSSQNTIFPDNKTLQTTYQYAQEKGNQKLIDANMVGIPLETATYKNGKGISKVETIYPDQNTFPSSQAGNLLLPLSVHSTQINTINIYNSPIGEVKDTEVTFDQYDNLGNLLQFTTKANIPTAIIWGYNQTQPIAKIEGATYPDPNNPKLTDVSQNLITAITNASNLDIDPTSEQTFITALDDFRKNPLLANFQISTFTYDPLIGVTSITPPSGIRENYKYDTANRLQSVVDVNGNILKEYKYNYKP